MSVYKSLSKIKKSVLLSLVSKETGVEVEYVVLRPDGRATGTNASTLDLKTFTKKERAIYSDMKNGMLFQSGRIYSSSKLSTTVKGLEVYAKNNKYSVVVLAENVE